MSERTTTIREEYRAVRGWLPWLFAAVYFPVYVVLDYLVGGPLAARLGLPRSVSVALVGLSLALVLTTAIVVARMDSVSVVGTLDEANPLSRARTGRRSTVGPGGAVNRRTVGSDRSSKTGDGGDDPSGPEARLASEADDKEEWPDEWIPGDQL